MQPRLVRALASLLAATLTPVCVWANDPPASIVAATNNASHEMIECAAYFTIVAEGMRITPGADTAKGADQYDSAREAALMYALALAESINQKPETLKARLEMSMQGMIDEIDRDYVNISILLNKYAVPCKSAVEDPAARLQWWIDRKTQ